MSMDDPVIDPFAHLHDEDYARAYDQPRITAEGLVSIAGRSARWSG